MLNNENANNGIDFLTFNDNINLEKEEHLQRISTYNHETETIEDMGSENPKMDQSLTKI